MSIHCQASEKQVEQKYSIAEFGLKSIARLVNPIADWLIGFQ